MNRIEIKNVTKSFGSTVAVNDVSASLESKRIYGLLGRNGAGKSTLLSMISNRIFPDSGEITIDGEPALENDSAQGKLFLMSESNLYPESFKVKKAFKWADVFYDNFDIESALSISNKFGLNINKKIKDLSTGYGSIFRIAMALSVGTPYVLLDEPVLGLDANHRDLFYKLLIQRYEEQPSCYVIATHLIEEAAGIIEDVIIIKEGSVLLNDSSENLMKMGYTVSGSAESVERYVEGKNIIGEDSLGGLKSVYIMDKVDRTGVPDNVEISKLDLQKLFIQLTNEGGAK